MAEAGEDDREDEGRGSLAEPFLRRSTLIVCTRLTSSWCHLRSTALSAAISLHVPIQDQCCGDCQTSSFKAARCSRWGRYLPDSLRMARREGTLGRALQCTRNIAHGASHNLCFRLVVSDSASIR